MRVFVVFLSVALVTGTALATGEQVPEPVGEVGQDVGEPAKQAAEPVEKAAEPVQESPPAAPAPVPPTGKVTRAIFTTGIENREPVDSLESLTNDQTQVFFFTEVQNMTGRTVTHRWEFKDEVVAEVSFDVGGPRWRVFSSKRLFPGWLGDWSVVVVDDSQNELGRHRLAYVPAPPSVESGAAVEEEILEEAPAPGLPEVKAPPPEPSPAPEAEAIPELETIPATPDEGSIEDKAGP